MRPRFSSGICCIATSLLIACQTAQTPVKTDEVISSIEFSTMLKKPSSRTGDLYLPAISSAPYPAVIMIHGTNGPDSRYDLHTRKLLNLGIAVLQVDFKSGIFTGPRDRPSSSTFVPMAYGALRALRKNPKIAPDRIGVIGFSLGGAIVMRTASERARRGWLDDGEEGFAVHVAYYPGCTYRMNDFSVLSSPKESFAGGPIMVLAGTEDSYGDGDSCPKLVDRINRIKSGFAELKMYQGVHHGFDGKKYWSG